MFNLVKKYRAHDLILVFEQETYQRVSEYYRSKAIPVWPK